MPPKATNIRKKHTSTLLRKMVRNTPSNPVDQENDVEDVLVVTPFFSYIFEIVRVPRAELEAMRKAMATSCYPSDPTFPKERGKRAWKDTWHTGVGSVLPKFQIVLIQSRKKKSEKTRQEVVIMDEQSAFYVVRKGSSIGVYKSLQDCQSQVSSSVCDPSVSVYKGYSMQKETEEYLSSKGLKNALFSIDAADCREDLFGTLVLCPFQAIPTKSLRRYPPMDFRESEEAGQGYCNKERKNVQKSM
ncbi:hypothetical protein ZOSMA_2G02120 [Zostera marina]|uniref:Ribonuclease H1 N-terminal domain-containing protein n=1 Tax=Zostera marina TaxID=29655 RepID=A0A0K9PD96_ZOSMR|nr:hypothetical protein ZOSMA_2G02120 [Zostera marina]